MCIKVRKPKALAKAGYGYIYIYTESVPEVIWKAVQSKAKPYMRSAVYKSTPVHDFVD